MERKEFLAKFGIGLAAVCAGCSMASCGSTPKQNDPNPTNGNGTGGNGGASLLSADLGTELKNIGEFKIGNGIILVRLAQGTDSGGFSAVQIACTHQGVSINWNIAQGKFVCPAHGSQFDTHGTVLQGPAATPLKEYKVNITGNSLTVTA